MRQVLIKYVFSVLFLSFGKISLCFAVVQPDLLKRLDRQFRSSDRWIPVETLYREAYTRLDGRGDDLNALSLMSQDDLLETLQGLQTELNVNDGVAENWLKIQGISKHCRQQTCFVDGNNRELVSGIHPDKLDELVKSFPHADLSKRDAREFDYEQYEFEEYQREVAENSDWYNIKMAFVYFLKGWHKTRTDTYHVFSRGAEGYPWMITAGQYETLTKVKNLRWSERMLQRLKQHPHIRVLENSPIFKEHWAAFWEYLRNWKFRGSIRGARSGRVFFKDLPFAEITANPIDAMFIEALMIRSTNRFSRPATETARIVVAADGRTVVEGATRRADDPLAVAIGSQTGGARGTSNLIGGLIYDVSMYGSEAHHFVGHFKTELEAHIAYLLVFPNSTLIADTNGVDKGWRPAIMAGQRRLAGLREDSNLDGKDLLVETVDWVKGELKKAGYEHLPIGVSNRITKKNLEQGTSADWLLAGTSIASVPSFNIVSKLAGYQDEGQPYVDVAKLSVGKGGLAGPVEPYRDVVTETDPKTGNTKKRTTGDLIAAKGERINPLNRDEVVRVNAEPFFEPGNIGEYDKETDTFKINLPRVPLREIAASALEEIRSLPADIETKGYPIERSREINRRLEKIRKAHQKNMLPRVGVFFGSFNWPHQAHEDIVRRYKHIYELDEVIIVPASDAYVRKKLAGKDERILSPQERISILERRFEDDNTISVSDIETSGKSEFAIDTLRLIEKGLNPGTQIYIIAGADLAATVSKWKEPDQLLENYNWIISPRDPEDELSKDPFVANRYEILSPRHYHHRNGRIMHMMEANVGYISSTQLRKESSEVDTVFHEVDLGETFIEGVEDMLPGTMAVKGSAKVIPYAIELEVMARDNPRVKPLASKDFHFRAEIENPGKWNPEFFNFVPHGQAGVNGPAGHQTLRFLDGIFPIRRQLAVPHMTEALVNGERALVPVEWDSYSYMDMILDPKTRVVFHKQGVIWKDNKVGGEVETYSYDFGVNRHSKSIIEAIKPKRVVIYGVATDWCVRAAAVRYRKMGYEVWVVREAIAGIHETENDHPVSKLSNVQATFDEFHKLGIRVVSMDEVRREYQTPSSQKISCLGSIREMAGAAKAE